MAIVAKVGVNWHF